MIWADLAAFISVCKSQLSSLAHKALYIIEVNAVALRVEVLGKIGDAGVAMLV